VSYLLPTLKNSARRFLSWAFIKFKKLLRRCFKFCQKKISFLPTAAQTRLFFNVLSKKEKIIFLCFFSCFILSFIFLGSHFYFYNTEIKPSKGGIITEGLVGQPRFINPVLASTDVDRNLMEIVFAGLMKYDSQGNIVGDLAEYYQISQDGKNYEIKLKENVFWQDGQPITSDDVVFTIKTIQNSDYKSPEFINWVGVTTEQISDKKVVFKLKKSYFSFLERLTLKILPYHIFKDIPPENFALTGYNLEPIGSGPFQFKELKYNKLGKIESISFERNKNYFAQTSYLNEIIFRFFETEEELATTAQKGQVQSLSISNPDFLKSLENKGFNHYHISLPRYFAVFINQKNSPILSQLKVREALNLALDRQEFLQEIIAGAGKKVLSPILSDIYGFNSAISDSDFNLEKAKELLKEAGFEEVEGRFINPVQKIQFNFTQYLEMGSRGKEVENLQTCLSRFPDIYPNGQVTGFFGQDTQNAIIAFQEKYRDEILTPWGFKNGTGIVAKTTREKLNEICNQSIEESPTLKFTLHTVNQPLLLKTAEVLKKQWQALGIEIEIKAQEFNELSQETIKPRNYQLLLFGQALNIIPDPFAFWHSSKIDDPGLNLSLYENKSADKALVASREAQTKKEFTENLEEFQEIIIQDKPAIFLYSPDFIYLVSNNVKGINTQIIVDPTKRFIDVENWYIKTKRVWK